ncbi:MAG: molecular chaperone TorD family protein [Gammaproteobacteria bacterium]
MPTGDSCSILEETAEQAPWLRDGLKELTALPLDRWQGEHTRLFISGYPHTACPPFESAYREGLMGGSTNEQLITLYQRVGLETQEIPPDYLGALLELAAHLLDRPEPWDAHLWTALWDEHVASWVPRFARDLVNAAQLTFYRRLGGELLRLFPDHG